MAETVTGTTVGDVKYVVAYFDVNTNNLYDANGQLYGNNTLATFLDNEFTLELHYVQDISTSSNPEEWAVWDGLKDLTVSSTLAFDDNYLHAVKGTIVADTEAGSPSVSVDVTDDINKDTLSRYGVLLVNPFGDEEDQLMIPYSSFQQISGTTFSFIVDDAQGLEASVTKDSPVRVSDPLYMFINANDIYEANIPNRYEEGVFKFPVNVMSRKLLNALDYSGSTGVSGTMEHKIYANKNTITGITVTGSTTVLKRDIDDDEVAGVHIAGVKTTNGGDDVYLRDASRDTTNDGTAYYAWLNDGGGVAFYTKTTNVTVGTLLYDETWFTQLDETVSALVDVVNPYLFCAWTNGATVSPTVFWTNGNEVDDGDAVYTILGGTATVVSGTTASPNITTEPILFRTFAFPFIVRNLVDYGVSLTIPTEDIDWTKEYIISIIRNNMEEVNGKASEGAYGVVMIDGSTDSSGVHTSNIHVSDGVISVPNASATVRGAVALSTESTYESEATSNEKAVTPAVVTALYTTLNSSKQNNLTFDTTTGFELVSGTTVKNDIATVEEVVKGTTGSNIVDADGLTGALSLGQAVDVSCSPTVYTPANISLDGGSTWTAFSQDIVDAHYLSDICYDFTGYSGNPSLDLSSFPKFADGLSYLFRFSVKNLGTASIRVRVYTKVTGADDVKVFDTSYSDSNYHTVALTLTARGWYAVITSSSAVKVSIKNWRQYEVTTLTDEAIQYLTQLENPDNFFRNSDIHSDTAITNPHPSVLSRYLVKQDMVAPWIPTINMPVNSPSMTVAAGLSYSITYTDNASHTVTVDTIPTNAYGWDAHIQMFVKGASNVQFKAPLILMDALTSNAGHNLTVKFRNGDALVYVDDLNAGNIVISTTCSNPSVAGELKYCLQATPASGYANYTIFGQVTDGAICDAGTVTMNYSNGVIGNGTDKTTITGTFNLPISGKWLMLQELSIKGSTLSEGTLYLINSAVETSLENNGYLVFQQTNTINGVVSGAGTYGFASGAVIYGSGTFDFTSKPVGYINFQNCNINGITLSGNIATSDSACYTINGTTRISNVTITGSTSRYNVLDVQPNSTLYLTDCSISQTTTTQAVNPTQVYLRSNARAYLHNITTDFGFISGVSVGSCFVSVSGVNKLTARCYAGTRWNIVAGSTVQNAYDYAMNFASCFVGTYNEQNSEQFVVGGTFTYINYDGSVSRGVGSIGYIIQSNGDNSFNSIYKVTASSGTASGSLYYGIKTSTERFIVIDYNPLSTTDVATAELDTDVTGRVVDFKAADGQTIVGGTFSLSTGSTVGVTVGKDADNVTDVSASTVNISGSSLSIIGDVTISGAFIINMPTHYKLKIGGNIAGKGTGIITAPISANAYFQTIQGNSIFNDISINKNIGLRITDKNQPVTFNNCKFITLPNTVSVGYGLLSKGADTLSIFNNLINESDASTIFNNGGGKIIFNNFVNNYSAKEGNFAEYAGGMTVLNNCKLNTTSFTCFASSEESPHYVVFSGYIENWISRLIVSSTSLALGTSILLISGSTVDISNSKYDIPIDMTLAGSIKVGTFADAVNYSGQWTTATSEAGAATIIASGGTYHVYGEGTFINKTLNPAGSTPEEKGTNLNVVQVTV